MSKISKAVTAAIVAALGAAGTALLNGGVTAADWGAIVGAAVAAGLAVWRVRNAPVQAGPRR